MNIEQAKICATLDVYRTKALFPTFNPQCFDIMCAWADGEEVSVGSITFNDWVFDGPRSSYTIKPKTYMMNGVECPAPYSEKPEIDDEYWVFGVDIVFSSTWSDNEHNLSRFNRGNCFKSEADAQATFDAVGGVKR
jgi:hypothetical protein